MSVYVTPFSPDQETKGTPTLINLLVDGSGSMDPIKPELVASINQDFLGALQAINDTEKKTVRVHAEVFN
ncbi:MAG: hypothetical protein NTW50_03425 [Candidatus Berkelbacteria bacterium]|nr:hypothetical protein [Candidatus Berkelbacteria bacterium]